MRKLSALGAALLIGGGLVAGAAPARAQELNCNFMEPPPNLVCDPVNRQLAHVNEELGYALDTVYVFYDLADRTVRCRVFGDCA